MSRNILTSSIQNASFSIVFQVLFRCITFLLNAFIIRHVGQTVLGIMNVRLLLLESTILFLSREPIFKACLTDTKSHNWAQVVNQIWLTVPLTGIISLLFVYVWMHILSATEDVYLVQYQYGCVAIAVSCVIDQMTQSVVLVAQSFCFVRLKVILETIYVMSRTIIFVVIVMRYPHYAIHAFSIAQVLSSIIYCLTHYGFFYWYIDELRKCADERNGIFSNMQDFPFKSVVELLPCVLKNDGWFLDIQLCKLTVSFFKQCIVKQILTEGERYVMTISPVLTFSEQSMYDIVNNLGSLAARFIFRPIEESGYFYFTQMIKRGKPIVSQDPKLVLEASTVLNQLCRVVTSIGLLVVTFGQSYSYTLLNLYGGKVLTDDPLPSTLLQFHCVAVLLLAINGVTECYVFATMSDRQLDHYNYIMVIFSVMFLLISYILTSICGSIGFILANCVNMAARITHSIYYITNTYRNSEYKPLSGAMPTGGFIIALILSGILTKISQYKIESGSIVNHILIGAICFTLTMSVWMYENRNLLRIGIEKYRRGSLTKID